MSAGNPTRRAFLEKWFEVEGGAAHVALDAVNSVVGYGQRRPCIPENNHQVGPLYADSPQAAAALLQSLLSGVVGTQVTINIWFVLSLFTSRDVDRIGRKGGGGPRSPGGGQHVQIYCGARGVPNSLDTHESGTYQLDLTRIISRVIFLLLTYKMNPLHVV